MANIEQEIMNAQRQTNKGTAGQQTGSDNATQAGDYRRSEDRNDNPESFDDNYEASREDEITQDEADSEDENQS